MKEIIILCTISFLLTLAIRFSCDDKVKELKKTGLKSIVEEIWEGKK